MYRIKIETFATYTLFNKFVMDENEIENISREMKINKIFPEGTVVRDIYFVGNYILDIIDRENKEKNKIEESEKLQLEKEIQSKKMSFNDYFAEHTLKFQYEDIIQMEKDKKLEKSKKILI